MSVPLAVALLALLVALFALVALVAVYARVRALEAGRAAQVSGYASLLGRPAPDVVRPLPNQRRSVVGVLDSDCALCHTVWDGLRTGDPIGAVRFVGLVDRQGEFAVGGRAEMISDLAARTELFEGYAPALMVVDAAGAIVDRRFVYSDTDVAALLADMSTNREVSRA